MRKRKNKEKRKEIQGREEMKKKKNTNNGDFQWDRVHKNDNNISGDTHARIIRKR
ncbi:hypothetical protein M1146_03810 [Patescibacteria group bacterium]|nr:hypothetical protein [Patescibacteria group bacterium]